MPDSTVSLLSFLLSQFSGFFKFSVSLFEYFQVSAVQFVGWCNVANCAVQSDGVVVIDVLLYDSAGIVKGKRDTRTDAFSFDCLVESLQLAV